MLQLQSREAEADARITAETESRPRVSHYADQGDLRRAAASPALVAVLKASQQYTSRRRWRQRIPRRTPSTGRSDRARHLGCGVIAAVGPPVWAMVTMAGFPTMTGEG